MWTSCRHAACARGGRAAPVLHVHVVHAARRSRSSSSGRTIPDSQTSHLPLAALRGHHRDDWEGLLVAFAADGSLLGARASAHSGFNGTSPWWEQAADDWAPYARCRLPRERLARARLPALRPRPGGRRLERRPGHRRAGRVPARGGRSRGAARPRPSTPRSRRPGTRPPGATRARATRARPAPAPSRIAAAARVWAEAYALGAW